MGVGQYYEDFSQTSDEEVRELLTASKDRRPMFDVWCLMFDVCFVYARETLPPGSAGCQPVRFGC